MENRIELSDKQKEISDLFAGYNKEIKDRFNEVKTLTQTSGSLLLKADWRIWNARSTIVTNYPSRL
jgi:hypothetical protein